MDFISNLIKRPISLVINETAGSIDKYPAEESSASLPNNHSNFMENSKVKKSASEDREINYSNKNNVTLNMSSSCHAGGNITDFIGVPEGYLEEFDDILPPPPPQNNSLVDVEITHSLLATPPPPSPPPLMEQESESMLTPSMKASQTIDELLSHINDNLQQAGLNDDVLAIASPPNKLELTPLSGKAVLNNSKLSTSLNTHSSASNIQILENTPTTAAGSVSTVFEKNSSVHKFDIDPELEAGLTNDHHQEKHYVEDLHQLVTTKDYLNHTGVNKLSNKFVGLTEFDETKIPELPDDLNPNIEEQYNITFEECFIPTLTAQQEIKVPDEFGIDRTHLLLPTEADTISSDYETFADCTDEKDALATTFSETGNIDATTDLESYRSAVNNTMNDITINDTMENIADLAKEVEAHPLQKANEALILEEVKIEHDQKYEHMEEDEPMDIDINSTMEIIQNTSNNIQHVEKVLQHAENILQQIEDSKQENTSLEINTTVECQNLEANKSKQELTLKQSVELSLETKNLNTECNIKHTENEAKELQNPKTDVTNNLNITVDCVNSSSISISSAKTLDDVKDESKLNLTLNSSMASQKSSAPASPSFPSKQAQNEGFPRSPKTLLNKQPQSPFLEKSNYADNFQSQNTEEKLAKNLNATFVEECSQSKQLNGSLTKLNLSENSVKNTDNEKCLSKTPQREELETNATVLEINTINNKRQTFSIDQQAAEEKRRTFSIQSHESQDTKMQFPAAVDKPADTRRTFCVNDASTNPEDNIFNEVDDNTRRTFNINLGEKETEQTAIETSFEPMDIDDTISQNTIPHEEGQPPSPAVSLIQKDSQPIENLPIIQQKSQPPAVPVMAKQKSQSPTLPTVHQKSQSPPLPKIQQNSQSPPLTLSQTVQEVQLRPQSPPLPAVQQRLQSNTVPAVQQRSQSPPLPTLQKRSHSPPLPAIQQQKTKVQPVQLSSLGQQTFNIKEEQVSPTLDNVVPSSSNPHSQPLPILIQKRPSIRDIRSRPDILSAKEQNNIKVKDEKDVVIEKCTPSPIEDVYSVASTTPTNTSGFPELNKSSSSSSSLINKNTEEQEEQFEEEFGGNNNIILNPSDFDYLLTKGNNNTPVDRSSLLLKFDPFLGVPVPVNQGPQQQQQLQQQLQLQIPTNTINPCLSPTLEEDEHNDSNRSFVIETKSAKGSATAVDGVEGELTETSAKILKERSQEVKQQLKFKNPTAQQNKNFLKQEINKKNATMSVDVIKDISLDNDCNKTFENSNSTQSDDKQINYKMDELEKKIKNEVLKTEDIEKKLKDAEQREEALIKRITEKDKTVAKMTGVIEAYEKAIAELIAEKEQLIQNYEKQLAEVKADRDSNYHHLTSLETTFSDLHVKYEKSKEMTCQLKASEEALQAEKRKNLENLHLQEQRYDKMKNHAMQQLEIANKKLESLTRDHSIEITKLKALLKKEEIARSSINEQLAQKTKENAELVKICDELIANQGS